MNQRAAARVDRGYVVVYGRKFYWRPGTTYWGIAEKKTPKKSRVRGRLFSKGFIVDPPQVGVDIKFYLQNEIVSKMKPYIHLICESCLSVVDRRDDLHFCSGCGANRCSYCEMGEIESKRVLCIRDFIKKRKSK